MDDPNQISVATFDKLASHYASKYFDLDIYNPQLVRFADAVTPAVARVLDLACGPGNVAAFLQRIRPDWQLCGIDLAPGMIREARARVPDVEFLVADCRQLAHLGQRFDGVAWAFGLSYLSDPDARQCLQALQVIMHDGAPLYLSSISGIASAVLEQGSTGDAVFQVYRPQAQILALVQEAGFVLEWQHAIASPANASKVTQDLLLLARKV